MRNGCFALLPKESFGGDHPFSGEFLTQLGRLVPADWISYFEVPRLLRRRPGSPFRAPLRRRLASSVDWAAVKPVRDAEDLLAKRYRSSFSAAKLSDFISRRELHRTRLYHVLMKPCGLEDMLGLRPRASKPMIFSLDRAGPGFSARDRAVLDALSPRLVRIHRAAESRRALREALAAHESGGAAVVLLERDDRVAFASTAAREPLQRYFGKNGSRCPIP